MISHRNQFVFIDICKTAGTSIGATLRAYGGRGKHHAIARPLPQIRQNRALDAYLSEHEKSTYFKFTFVRNPWDRALSLFSYCQNSGLQDRFATYGWPGLMGASQGRMPRRAVDRETYWPTDFPTFLKWVADYEDYFIDFTLEKYISMVEWLKDNDGQINVDFVGRFENLAADFLLICQTLDIPNASLEHLRKSHNRRDGSYRDAYDIETRNLVKHVFREDIAEFGYEF